MTAMVNAIPNGHTSHSEASAEALAGFAPHVLRDHALLADGYRGALVGPRDEIGFAHRDGIQPPYVLS